MTPCMCCSMWPWRDRCGACGAGPPLGLGVLAVCNALHGIRVQGQGPHPNPRTPLPTSSFLRLGRPQVTWPGCLHVGCRLAWDTFILGGLTALQTDTLSNFVELCTCSRHLSGWCEGCSCLALTAGRWWVHYGLAGPRVSGPACNF